ncbi:MAG: hypothetical protein LBH04_03650 [Tannerellaceae bacterium]|nr:hypothetical protein [Tannerellaceae bacterium]
MNKFLMFTVALGIVFLSSCTNEEKMSTYAPEEGDGTMSFVLPLGKKGPVTYATIAADSAENTIQTLRIYCFDPSGILIKVFSHPSHKNNELSIYNFSQDENAATATATIATGTMSGLWHFYFVANVNNVNQTGGTVPGITSSALAGVQLTNMTEAVFQQMLLDELNTQPDGSLVNINTPLPMSLSKNDHSGLSYIEVNPEVTKSATIHMKRRVARFDIINNAEFTGFTVKNIVISNAKSAGFVQDSADVSPNSGRMIIDVEATANGTPLDHSIDEHKDNDKNGIIDGFEGANAKDSFEWNKSQFYLYPTKLTKSEGGTAGATILAIEGSYKGETRIYTLNLKDGNDMDILANQAYKINIHKYVENEFEGNFTIEPWGWDEDTIDTSRDQRFITFDHVQLSPNDPNSIFDISAIGGGTNEDDKVDTIRYTAAPGQEYAELLLVTKGYTLSGDLDHGNVASLALQAPYPGFLPEDLQAISEAHDACYFTTVRTYAVGEGLRYETTHHIKLPHTTAPIAFDILVQSQTNATRAKKYYVESWDYNKLGYAPVKLGNLLWAPLNVGATAFTTNTKQLPVLSKDSANGYAWTGDLFQWGRNTPFNPLVTYIKKTTQFYSVDSANSYAAKDSMYVGTANNWLDTRDDNLWSGVNEQGPCPNGWRVPTTDEWGILIAAPASGATKNISTNWLYLPINTTDTICIPNNGEFDIYNNKSGSVSLYPGMGGTTKPNTIHWTSSVDATSGYPYRVYVNGTGTNLNNAVNTTNDPRSQGYAIRAVRNWIPMPGNP